MYEWIYLASIWGLSDEIWDFLQVNVTQSAFNPYNVVGHLIALSLTRRWVCALLPFPSNPRLHWE